MNFGQAQRTAREEWDRLHSGDAPVISVGTATCGRSAGALDTLDVLRGELAGRDLACRFVEVGCLGPCYAEPLVTVSVPGKATVCFGSVDIRGARKIAAYVAGGDLPEELAFATIGPEPIDGIPDLMAAPMMKGQVRRILRNCGVVDPGNIHHSLARGAYSGLQRALALDTDARIGELEKSGLRGRGGAGFPVSRKWQFCIDAPGETKYVICNADEGDPGAFMNRSLLEGDPHALLEGMIIAGLTIGAAEGIIYCRAEYPLALERLAVAIRQAEQAGFLGPDALGPGRAFRIRVKEGAGAFVCGEETALIASLEGRRGMPRPRPPFPAVSGLWGCPTVINNVETLASVGLIFQNSAAWYAEYGTEKSKGTKTFALVGNVQRPGLVEVPLGTTLREMIFEIGGGISGGHRFKAVQTGGPSGGCLPEDKLDIPVDYESLQEAGTIMGSGGIVVMDERTCMVDFARYFLDFAADESCGKCGPCRLGTRQLLRILEDITQGKGTADDLELLERLSRSVMLGSLCGLGATAPNPVLTTLRYFRDEYAAHVEGRTCPALACRDFIAFEIDEEKCTGCTACAALCPVDGIAGDRKHLHIINAAVCIKCGVCSDTCTFDAVETVDANA
ncbi:MAG: NADH-ubiquinone oxidoreductase-F iron-sulfur binding region domain-containing protein [Planctomycetota bacterium]|jgi:NADH-quinone oxidoreductase subunit F